MKMPKIPGWAYSRAKNICLENRPIPPLKMTHICMFKMRFITFRTVFKQELFFFLVRGLILKPGLLPHTYDVTCKKNLRMLRKLRVVSTDPVNMT